MKRLLIIALILATLFFLGARRRSLSGAVHLPYGDAVAAGDIGSFQSVNKFGFNNEVDNVEESIWEGDDTSYTAGAATRCPVDTSAFTLYISSDNALDTEANNIDIVVEGLDQSWKSQSVTVTAAGNGTGMSGVTFVQVGAASGWLRVNRAYNTGSSDVNGTIYIHTDSVDTGADGVPDNGSQTRAIITGNENQTLQACYTVPDGLNGYLRNFCGSTWGGAADPVLFRLRKWDEGGIGRVQTKWSIDSGQRSCQEFDPPVVYSEHTMLEVTGLSAGAGSNALTSGTFDLVLRPN